MSGDDNRLLTKVYQLAGKTVRAADNTDDGVIVAFTDGTYVHFEADEGVSGGAAVSISTYYGPQALLGLGRRSAVDTLGIMTAAEYDAAKADQDRFRDGRDRAEFERLRKQFEGTPAAPAEGQRC